jgi:hypothetical protein
MVIPKRFPMQSDSIHFHVWSALSIVFILVTSALVLCTIDTETAQGQPGSSFYIISGTVFDSKGDGVPNATIEILNRDTGEVQIRETNDRGNYSYNLANHQEGWEWNQEIVITARANVFNSETIIPRENDEDTSGAVQNITLEWLMIISPEANEKIVKDGANFTIEIAYLTTFDLSHITYAMDSVVLDNTTNTTLDLLFSDYTDGMHKFRVVITNQTGHSYSKEIFFSLETKEDTSDNLTFMLAVAIVVIIILIGLALYVKATSAGGKDN